MRLLQFLKLFTVVFFAINLLSAREVIPLSKTTFEVVNDDGSQKVVDLKGREFVVVSVREPGSDGRFYTVDRDGVVWWTGAITSGVNDYDTPSGIFPILYKKRHYMSKKYPDPSGVDNMDYSMFFTRTGNALHKGSVNWMSHGCIHIDPRDIETLYNWAKVKKTLVIITRKSYMPFARPDLLRFNLK